MNLAVNKLVLIIIFLVVLLGILYFIFFLSEPLGKNLIIQNEIRQCCETYKAGECKSEEVYCNSDYLSNLIKKINMDREQLKKFCGCS